jgi:predicted nucleotidyltransferase
MALLLSGFMADLSPIINTILAHHPTVQGIYLFGSYATADQRPDSDADIALLLMPSDAKKAGSLAATCLASELAGIIGRSVDLINLRQVSTVLQKEVVMADRRIFEGDVGAAEEFEMLTLSYYQKLNEERAGIIEDALAGGRFHRV